MHIVSNDFEKRKLSEKTLQIVGNIHENGIEHELVDIEQMSTRRER